MRGIPRVVELWIDEYAARAMSEDLAVSRTAQVECEILTGVLARAMAGDLDAIEWLEGRELVSLPGRDVQAKA